MTTKVSFFLLRIYTVKYIYMYSTRYIFNPLIPYTMSFRSCHFFGPVVHRLLIIIWVPIFFFFFFPLFFSVLLFLVFRQQTCFYTQQQYCVTVKKTNTIIIPYYLSLKPCLKLNRLLYMIYLIIFVADIRFFSFIIENIPKITHLINT